MRTGSVSFCTYHAQWCGWYAVHIRHVCWLHEQRASQQERRERSFMLQQAWSQNTDHITRKWVQGAVARHAAKLPEFKSWLFHLWVIMHSFSVLPFPYLWSKVYVNYSYYSNNYNFLMGLFAGKIKWINNIYQEPRISTSTQLSCSQEPEKGNKFWPPNILFLLLTTCMHVNLGSPHYYFWHFSPKACLCFPTSKHEIQTSLMIIINQNYNIWTII